MTATPPRADALRLLAGELRAERSVLAERVRDPGPGAAALGRLVAHGPRAAGAPDDYAVVVEAVREGYLLHHSEPRLLAPADGDLALLAGDYLYALGIERLAGLGDLEAVRELADLISLAAQLHAQGRDGEATEALWLGSVAAIACGSTTGHREAKEALRSGRAEATEAMREAAREAARGAGIGEVLDEAIEAIDFGARSG